jgi:hypothetical protein
MECSKIHERNEQRKSKELFEQVRKVQKKKVNANQMSVNDRAGNTLKDPEGV